jgi:hypothetical protein
MPVVSMVRWFDKLTNHKLTNHRLNDRFDRPEWLTVK